MANRFFKQVREDMKKTEGVPKMPKRASKSSMAYDFHANADYKVNPGKIAKIWTDIKAFMQQDECLILNVRSSMGGKFMLANTSGWIDSDYFENKDNDGNIGIFLLNISDEVQYIKKGDRIAQGAFFKFLCTDDDNVENTRCGGFGSSGK